MIACLQRLNQASVHFGDCESFTDALSVSVCCLAARLQAGCDLRTLFDRKIAPAVSRSRDMCVPLTNVTIVIPSEDELSYLVFMGTMYNSPSPSLRQLASFYTTDLKMTTFDVSVPPPCASAANVGDWQGGDAVCSAIQGCGWLLESHLGCMCWSRVQELRPESSVMAG